MADPSVREARITRHEVVHGNPPFPFIYWREDFVKRWLKREGFDLSKPIYRYDNPVDDSITCKQYLEPKRRWWQFWRKRHG